MLLWTHSNVLVGRNYYSSDFFMEKNLRNFIFFFNNETKVNNSAVEN